VLRQHRCAWERPASPAPMPIGPVLARTLGNVVLATRTRPRLARVQLRTAWVRAASLALAAPPRLVPTVPRSNIAQAMLGQPKPVPGRRLSATTRPVPLAVIPRRQRIARVTPRVGIVSMAPMPLPNAPARTPSASMANVVAATPTRRKLVLRPVRSTSARMAPGSCRPAPRINLIASRATALPARIPTGPALALPRGSAASTMRGRPRPARRPPPTVQQRAASPA
jgi:hypothetical protein